MFFRRQEGKYRETDRVTRFKLIKSGKHWLRASISHFGLFKVLRGGVDTAQVTTEVIEEQASTTLTGLDILKGIAAVGTVFGGAVATQTTVYTNDALEKTVEAKETLANTDTVTLGTVKDQEGAQADSLSVSVSQSQSMSEEASKNASKHLSESESQSVNLSTSESLSASLSASGTAGATESVLTSDSQSQVGSTSELLQSLTSATASNKETAVRQGNVTNTKVAENRKRLSEISAEMEKLLAQSAGLSGTDVAVAKVNAAVLAIEEALKNPDADLTDVIKQAKAARNSIRIVVNRAHNGAQNPLNGKQIPTGVGFRSGGGYEGPAPAEEDPAEEASASESTSESESTSVSESASKSASASESTSESESISALASTSVSESISADRLHSESTSEVTGNSSNKLPNTGTEASKLSIVLGALAGVTGLGLLAKRRHDENEDEV